MDLPEPTGPLLERSEVFLQYLGYFRERIIQRVNQIPLASLREAAVPSGWTPLELLQHVTFVEMRWLEWGYEGRAVKDPWGDRLDDRWHVGPLDTREILVERCRDRGRESERIVRRHSLEERGLPGPRWDGREPPTLERVLFHLLQEFARHLGHVDIVAELAGVETGE